MKKNLALMFATAALLAACGGDSDGPLPPAPTPAPAPAPAAAPSVPTSASATINSFFDYLASLVATKSETDEPLVIPATFTTPVSDTDSPRTLP